MVIARAGIVALALPCAAALAQAPGANAPPASGLPRSILPPFPSTDLAPLPDAGEPAGSENNSGAAAANGPAQAGVPRGRAPTIEVGDLGAIEGPVAGLIDDSNGGLGYDMWQGANRATVMTMLKSVPATTASEAQRLLMRKILLTAAPPPPGAADASFNALRITKLIDAGLIEDAADLALKVNAPTNGEIVQAQADALIYGGRDMAICGDLTQRRLDSADAFWVELRAYCYAVAKDEGALELTRSVIETQGIADPAFMTLLDGLVSGKATAPEVIRLPDPLQLLILQRQKLPIPAEMGSALGLAANLAIAASPVTPKQARIAGAEKALRAGVLPTPLLGEILDTYSFGSPELAAAPAIARREPLLSALARLRAALKKATQADERADLIHTAFEIGEREGLLGQVALLFADDTAAIVPPRDWGNWSDLMERGLLLAGQSDAAQRWYAILNPDLPSSMDVVSQLELALALAAPDVADDALTQANLSALAQQASSAGPAVSPAVLARATLALGLFDALGRPMPPEAEAAVGALVRQPSLGRRPAPALMQRIDRAVTSGARGELALSVAAALGTEGARDLAPDVVVRLVLALRSAGIQDAADALASEAMLLRPSSGS
jgi:hypothetical protein